MLDQAARCSLALIGCRRLRPVTGCQNLVVRCRWQGRQVVVKVRRQDRRRRLDKELTWLRTGAEVGWPVPTVLNFAETADHVLLVLQRLSLRTAGSWRDWAALLAPIHARVPAQSGFGPLRADGRPRWTAVEGYHAWQDELLGKAGLQLVAKAPVAALRARGCCRLLHGDAHAGNRIGKVLLDWETVAAGDPLLDWARLALASGRSASDWAACAEIEPADPAWLGARLVVAAEALRYGGPAWVGAERLRRLVLADRMELL